MIRRQTFLLICLGLVMLWPTALSAQNRSVSLDEITTLAIQHSRQLRADSFQTAAAKGSLRQAYNDFYPQVNLRLSYLRISDNITPFSVDFPTGKVILNPQILDQSYNALEVRQPIWAGGRLTSAVELQKQQVLAEQAESSRDSTAVQLEIASLWYNLYIAKASSKILEANQSNLTARRKDAQHFAEQGSLLANEVLKLDLAVSTIDNSLLELRNNIDLLNYSLCVLAGLPAETVLEPASDASLADPFDSFEGYESSALNGRPELASLAHRRAAAELGVKLASSSYFPNLSFGGNYHYDRPNIRLFPSQPKFTGTWDVGIFMNWSLSDLILNRAKTSQRRFQALQTNEVYELTRERIRLEVRKDFDELNKAKDRVKLAQQQVQQATENFRVEQNKFQNNSATATDLLNANALLLQSSLNLSSAEAGVALAKQKLRQSAAIK